MQPAKMTHATSTARLTKIIVPPSMSIAPNHAPGAKRRVSSLPASTRRSLPRGVRFRDRPKVFNPIGAFFVTGADSRAATHGEKFRKAGARASA